MKSSPSVQIVAATILALISLSVTADDTADDGRESRLEEVIVTGRAERQLLLDTKSEAGSRLGLSLRETPATLDVVTQDRMRDLGLSTSIDVLDTAPGVQASFIPGTPSSASIRGFTGGAVSLLHDGLRLSTSAMIGRNYDTWSFERIEVLKGPASVMYGEGSIAGAINLVPKRVSFDRSEVETLVSAGSFDTYRVGLGATGPLSSTLGYRFDASRAQSGGFIDGTDSETTAVIGSVEWRPSENVRATLAIDYFEDDYDTAYWGTPLVPAAVARHPTGVARDSIRRYVIDEALRERNYNVNDGDMHSEQLWMRGSVQWDLSANWHVSAQVYGYDADRIWRNSEIYSPVGASSTLLNRSLVAITHEHEFYGSRVAAGHRGELWGIEHRFVAGMEYSDTDFFSPRRFSDGSSATNAALRVDAYAPIRGFYFDDPAMFTGAGNRTNFTTGIGIVALFAEEAVNLTDDLLVLGGVRTERIELDRGILDVNTGAATSFEREFEPTSWRIGAVYDLTPSVQLFAQYNEAVAPVATILLMSAASSRFNLSTGVSYEAGIKATWLQGRLDTTVSAYRITQDEILTRDPANANITVQGGQQSSRGAELAVSFAATDHLRLDANLALLHAQFDRLIEAGGANRNGNLPPNVSEQQANLWLAYELPATPLALGAGVHHVGPFFTNNDNSIRVAGYTTYDASITYRLPVVTLALRGRNLTDELYAESSGASAGQLLLGAPRSYEISAYARF